MGMPPISRNWTAANARVQTEFMCVHSSAKQNTACHLPSPSLHWGVPALTDEGVEPAPGPRALTEALFPAGAHSLETGAGTWAMDTPCPERKRAGMPGPLLSRQAWLDWGSVRSHGMPRDTERGMQGSLRTWKRELPRTVGQLG